jgi:hypothetical protein
MTHFWTFYETIKILWRCPMRLHQEFTRPYDPEHGQVDFPIAGQDVLSAEGEGLSQKVRYPPAGLCNHQAPGGYVPGTQFHFPESVETSRGHITKIESRGSGAAHGLSPDRKIVKVVKVVDFAFPEIVGEAGGEQAAGKV